jgi:hypothetical protein
VILSAATVVVLVVVIVTMMNAKGGKRVRVVGPARKKQRKIGGFFGQTELEDAGASVARAVASDQLLVNAAIVIRAANVVQKLQANANESGARVCDMDRHTTSACLHSVSYALEGRQYKHPSGELLWFCDGCWGDHEDCTNTEVQFDRWPGGTAQVAAGRCCGTCCFDLDAGAMNGCKSAPFDGVIPPVFRRWWSVGKHFASAVSKASQLGTLKLAP